MSLNSDGGLNSRDVDAIRSLERELSLYGAIEVPRDQREEVSGSAFMESEQSLEEFFEHMSALAKTEKDYNPGAYHENMEEVASGIDGFGERLTVNPEDFGYGSHDDEDRY